MPLLAHGGLRGGQGIGCRAHVRDSFAWGARTSIVTATLFLPAARCENFAVKLREAMSVAGVAKVTDAVREARFQSFDPALSPQPVRLKMGGWRARVAGEIFAFLRDDAHEFQARAALRRTRLREPCGAADSATRAGDALTGHHELS